MLFSLCCLDTIITIVIVTIYYYWNHSATSYSAPQSVLATICWPPSILAKYVAYAPPVYKSNTAAASMRKVVHGWKKSLISHNGGRDLAESPFGRGTSAWKLISGFWSQSRKDVDRRFSGPTDSVRILRNCTVLVRSRGTMWDWRFPVPLLRLSFQYGAQLIYAKGSGSGDDFARITSQGGKRRDFLGPRQEFHATTVVSLWAWEYHLI